MAIYILNYRHWSHGLDAPTKAAALKTWYNVLVGSLGPEGVTFKVFTKECSAVRQKAVKVEHWTCPVDGQRLGRKEFVSHVRNTHQ
jgi:hypothetical protein